MAITSEQTTIELVTSEIFTLGGIECRLTVSQSRAGYKATAYCPFCGKGVGSEESDAVQESAVSQTKAKLYDHFGHCPMRNAEYRPLEAKLAWSATPC